MQYGVLIMEEGRFEEAHEVLMTSYSLDPDEAETIFYLAEIHAHLGLLRDAKAYAEKYIVNRSRRTVWRTNQGKLLILSDKKNAFYEEDEV